MKIEKGRNPPKIEDRILAKESLKDELDACSDRDRAAAGN